VPRKAGFADDLDPFEFAIIADGEHMNRSRARFSGGTTP